MHKKQAINFDTTQYNSKQLKELINDSTISEINQEKKLETNDIVSALKPIKQIVFACEAGMGSSAMGASLVRRLLKDKEIEDIQIINKALKIY